MKFKVTFLSCLLLTSVLTGCAVNEQHEPEDINYEPTRYDQRDRMDDGNGGDMGPDFNTPNVDRDEQEPDLGEEPSEERNNNNNDNNNNNREMDERLR
ncbi:hypothetical protein [Halobacillus sp. H74]|uniref:hypothetical protein n=1 Tax=Halobacillus sp. H74 TaxID=3457436 RepID=UPI003FCC46D2